MSDGNILLAQVRNPLIVSNFGSGSDYFSSIISTLVNILFIIATVIFVFIFIIGAFQWITSGSDKGKLAEARGRITHAIIGLLVLLLIFVIAQFVNALLGINIGFLGGTYSGCNPPTRITKDSGSLGCNIHCGGLKPYGYCVEGNNPCSPASGCSNSGYDCTTAVTADCWCCPMEGSGAITEIPTGATVSTVPTKSYDINCKPVLQSPSDNYAFITNTFPFTVNYSWTPCIGASYYEFFYTQEFCYSSGFCTITIGGSYQHLISNNNSLSIPDIGSASNTIVRWRVQPCFGTDPGVFPYSSCVNPGIISSIYTYTVSKNAVN